MRTTNPAGPAGIALDSGGRPTPAGRLRPLDVLLLSAWCGLAAGWLEVGTRVLLKRVIVADRMYQMSRQFVWAVPLSNLLLFSVTGLFLAVATKLWPRRAGWLSPRVICTAAITPMLMVAVPQVFTLAWLVLACGIAIRVVPRLERPATRWRRWLIASLPVLLGLVPVVAGFVFAGDWLKERAKPRALAAGRFSQRTPDRAGHGAGGQSEPLRLPTPDYPGPGSPGETGYSLRRGAVDRSVDTRLARQYVYGPPSA